MSVANGAYTRTNSFGGEADRIVPRFFIESVEDPIATQQQGRPIFRDEERVEIILPGNPHTKPVHRVTNEHRERWAQQYKAFKDGNEMAVDGTPLEQWPVLKRGMVLELKAMGFTTVEQIAAMDDLACQRIGMGGTRLRTLAKGYLDEAQAGAALAKATADNERKDAQIAELSRKVEEQATLLSQVHSDLQAMKNAPSQVQSFIPSMADPVEQAKAAQPAAGASALDSLAPPRERRQKRAGAETSGA